MGRTPMQDQTYGWDAKVALTSVECPNCGHVQVSQEDDVDGYRCGSCLTKFSTVGATVYGMNEDPR